ncbi:LytR/AlgR family response regulator transcription factor [Sphingobacterium sp. LRF_L2]|uniref:LytR/AlgR family response regulator transcription factor n=1 Tax=Sphingobacterium sp. LRF_L2 TaxID=3369421 RepID=UPI003F6339C4
MQTIKCIAVDDEPLALDIIKNFSLRVEGLELLHTFDDATKVDAYVQGHAVDVMFLDIDMPDIDGISLAKQLTDTYVIFTTAYKDYAVESYDLDAVDFLLKPFTFERFETAVGKVRQKLMSSAPRDGQYLTVYSGYRLTKIRFSEIEYLESISDYVRIHLLDGSAINTLSTLKSIQDKLSSAHFLKVHRSYIVATNVIRSFKNKELSLRTTAIPVGPSYIQAVKDYLRLLT